MGCQSCHYVVCAIIFISSFVVANGRFLNNFNNSDMSCTTIVVDKSHPAQFSTIQSAIDSVPANNQIWVIIKVKAGIYRENVTVPMNKRFIALHGEGMNNTKIIWNEHEDLLESATFHLLADDFVAVNITFVNSYNHAEILEGNPRKPAAAALVSGDRASFYRCGFYGLQDTLWDEKGRHYFKDCFIEGAVDFICGNGQSLYETCEISVIDNQLEPNVKGFITAQRRSSATEGTAFVFKACKINGIGKAFLGRAWGPYSAVLFYKSYLSDLVEPEGWQPWKAIGHEENTMYAEQDNCGPGSDTSKRVRWMHKLDPCTLNSYINLSFINSDGWLQSQPTSSG